MEREDGRGEQKDSESERDKWREIINLSHEIKMAVLAIPPLPEDEDFVEGLVIIDPNGNLRKLARVLSRMTEAGPS